MPWKLSGAHHGGSSASKRMVSPEEGWSRGQDQHEILTTRSQSLFLHQLHSQHRCKDTHALSLQGKKMNAPLPYGAFCGFPTAKGCSGSCLAPRYSGNIGLGCEWLPVTKGLRDGTVHRHSEQCCCLILKVVSRVLLSVVYSIHFFWNKTPLHCCTWGATLFYSHNWSALLYLCVKMHRFCYTWIAKEIIHIEMQCVFFCLRLNAFSI